MVRMRRNYGSFLAICVASLFIVFLGVPQVESDATLCVEPPYGQIGMPVPIITDPNGVTEPPNESPYGPGKDPVGSPVVVDDPNCPTSPLTPIVTESPYGPGYDPVGSPVVIDDPTCPTSPLTPIVTESPYGPGYDPVGSPVVIDDPNCPTSPFTPIVTESPYGPGKDPMGSPVVIDDPNCPTSPLTPIVTESPYGPGKDPMGSPVVIDDPSCPTSPPIVDDPYLPPPVEDGPYLPPAIDDPSVVAPCPGPGDDVIVIDDPNNKLLPNEPEINQPHIIPGTDPFIDPIGIPAQYYHNPPDLTVTYKIESQDGGLGIKMAYPIPASGGDKMNIMVAYDSESSDAATFFAEQFTIEVIQGLNRCEVIQWELLPCMNSKMDNGALLCPKDEQSEVDKILACVTTTCDTDKLKLASFITCFFGQGKQAEKCACKNDLNYDDIQTCAQGEDGATQCDIFYNTYHCDDFKADSLYPETCSAGLDGISDFKNTVCTKLTEASLTCGFCSPPQTGYELH